MQMKISFKFIEFSSGKVFLRKCNLLHPYSFFPISHKFTNWQNAFPIDLILWPRDISLSITLPVLSNKGWKNNHAVHELVQIKTYKYTIESCELGSQALLLSPRIWNSRVLYNWFLLLNNALLFKFWNFFLILIIPLY